MIFPGVGAGERGRAMDCKSETILSTAVQVGHRTLGSSSTGGITGYLNAKCPANWALGAGSTVSWPTTSGFTPAPGTS